MSLSFQRRRRIRCFTKGFHCLLYFHPFGFSFAFILRIYLKRQSLNIKYTLAWFQTYGCTLPRRSEFDRKEFPRSSSFPFINNSLAWVHGKRFLSETFPLPSPRCWARYMASDLWVSPGRFAQKFVRHWHHRGQCRTNLFDICFICSTSKFVLFVEQLTNFRTNLLCVQQICSTNDKFVDDFRKFSPKWDDFPPTGPMLNKLKIGNAEQNDW